MCRSVDTRNGRTTHSNHVCSTVPPPLLLSSSPPLLLSSSHPLFDSCSVCDILVLGCRDADSEFPRSDCGPESRQIRSRRRRRRRKRFVNQSIRSVDVVLFRVNLLVYANSGGVDCVFFARFCVFVIPSLSLSVSLSCWFVRSLLLRAAII